MTRCEGSDPDWGLDAGGWGWGGLELEGACCEKLKDSELDVRKGEGRACAGWMGSSGVERWAGAGASGYAEGRYVTKIQKEDGILFLQR